MADFEQRSSELFKAAIDIPPSEWPRFLEQHCESAEIRQRVTRLLDFHASSNQFLERSASSTYPAFSAPFGGQIDEFRIIRLLGQGGMGQVYLAEDILLKRLVALKIILHPTSDDQNPSLDTIRREARAAARLSHPGIVQVYRAGEKAGFSFIAMEYVDGVTLRQYLDEIKKNSATINDKERLASIAKYISQIADALDYAHRASVIHRDVKPTNILIDSSGNARLNDFGIARITTEPTLNAADAIVGSYAYMSPEQAKIVHTAIDHRSDIFSLGVILYEGLCYTRPFTGQSMQEIFRSLQEAQPVPVPKLFPKVPKDLAIICHKAIECDLTYRYQTAGHLSAELRCFLDGRPILTVAPSRWRLCKAWLRQRIRLFLLLIFCALVIALIASMQLMTTLERKNLGIIRIPKSMQKYSVSIAGNTDDLVQLQFQPLGHPPIEKYLPPGLYRLAFEHEGVYLEASSLLDPGYIDSIELREPTMASIQSFAFIPGGRYPLGRAGSTYPLSSIRIGDIEPFRISKVEVSNRDYRNYVIETQARPLSIWPVPYVSDLDDLPVVDVSWDEANQYCRWNGVRLPTPNEWEIAARGPNGNVYPWGKDLLPTIVREDSEELNAQVYRLKSKPVLIDPNPQSASGLLHLHTNVQEYTEGIAIDRNRGLIIKGRSWAESPFKKPADLVTLSGRSVRSFDRGFRVTFNTKMDR